jgi:transcriptional regulator with XRE-family HTH domain
VTSLSDFPSHEDALKFGTALRRLRIERGYTQERLARELGIQRSYFARLDRGCHLPRPRTVDRICRFFGITRADLGYRC